MPLNPRQRPEPYEVACAIAASGTSEACRAAGSPLGNDVAVNGPHTGAEADAKRCRPSKEEARDPPALPAGTGGMASARPAQPPLVSLVVLHVRRQLLRGWLERREQGMPDDITVVIGHRDRADYRLANALRSLRTQDYDGGDIHVVVVDYGSSADQLSALRKLCTESAVELITASGGEEWSRGRCLNIGIKRATTRFVMVSDVDVIFGGNYVTEAVAALREDPLAAVYSRCVHLPENAAAELERAASDRRGVDREALRSLGREMPRLEFSAGIVAAHTSCFQAIGGYDEFYCGYGSEDSDLALRFLRLGLRLVPLRDRSFYLHQWHPKYEGVDPARIDEFVRRNADYLDRTDSIARNPSGWGEGRG